MVETRWLTVELVEQLHRAHSRGKPVEAHVSAFTDCTLPALIEYGCLRRHLPSLPPLPPAIVASPIAQELSTVASEIGIRTSGYSQPPSRSHEPREMEFVIVRDENDLLSDPIQLMFMRVAQSTKRAGFSELVAHQFQGALHEMINNAVEHSNSPIPALVGYHIRPNLAQFVVADVGRGVFDSLRENPKHADVTDHCQAIRKALRDGVTRHNEPRGNGFHPIFVALTESWGVLRFRSRLGCLTMNGTDLSVNQGINHFPPELPGFQVSVTCQATGTAASFPVT